MNQHYTNLINQISEALIMPENNKTERKSKIKKLNLANEKLEKEIWNIYLRDELKSKSKK